MNFSDSFFHPQSPQYKKILFSLLIFSASTIFFFMTRYSFFFSVPLFLYYPLWTKRWSLAQLIYWFMFAILLDGLAGYETAHSFAYFMILYFLNLAAYRFIFIDTWRAAVILGILSHITLHTLYIVVYPGTVYYSRTLLFHFMISQGIFMGLSLILYPCLARRMEKKLQ